MSKLTKHERKANRKEKRHQSSYKIETPHTGLTLRQINPLTPNQRIAFTSFEQGNNLALHGVAGTGKTFVSLYLACRELEVDTRYTKVIIVRSAVPTRDAGFLPGTIAEKAAIYEAPYIGIVNSLYARGDAYKVMKNHNMIEFISTSYVRGTTIDNCIVIVDEIQNMTDHELNSVITRLGDNTRLIVCGDLCQNDLKKERSSFATYMKIFKRMDNFGCVEFDTSDIVRSGFVRDYIVTRHMLEQSGEVASLSAV